MSWGRKGLTLAAFAVAAFAVWLGWAALTPVTPDNVETRLTQTCAVAMTLNAILPATGQGTGAKPWTVCACVAGELGKEPAAAAPLAEALRRAVVLGEEGAEFERALQRLGEIAPKCAG